MSSELPLAKLPTDLQEGHQVKLDILPRFTKAIESRLPPPVPDIVNSKGTIESGLPSPAPDNENSNENIVGGTTPTEQIWNSFALTMNIHRCTTQKLS
jgi:hypothetical protein